MDAVLLCDAVDEILPVYADAFGRQRLTSAAFHSVVQLIRAITNAPPKQQR
jgi:hypothetical protein